MRPHPNSTKSQNPPSPQQQKIRPPLHPWINTMIPIATWKWSALSAGDGNGILIFSFNQVSHIKVNLRVWGWNISTFMFELFRIEVLDMLHVAPPITYFSTLINQIYFIINWKAIWHNFCHHHVTITLKYSKCISMPSKWYHNILLMISIKSLHGPRCTIWKLDK